MLDQLADRLARRDREFVARHGHRRAALMSLATWVTGNVAAALIVVFWTSLPMPTALILAAHLVVFGLIIGVFRCIRLASL